jgi:thiamine pyrophosphokinase
MRAMTIELPQAGEKNRVAVVALSGASARELRTAMALARALARPPARPPLVIAVDGGLSTCRRVRLRPDLFVGDLDSARAAPASVEARIYPVDKDFSDLAGALTEARRARAAAVTIAGVLGGRLDHEWANLLEIGAAASAFAGIIAPTARGTIVVTARGLRVRHRGQRLVSVFALGESARVSVRGAAWELARRRLRPGSLGLSNLSAGDLAVDVHDGVAAIVFPAGRVR